MSEPVDTVVHWPQDGRVAVERRQDVEPILDFTTAAHNEGVNVTGMGDKWAASFPKVIVENYCARNRITLHEWVVDPYHIKAMLNDPALAAFRPWKGRV